MVLTDPKSLVVQKVQMSSQLCSLFTNDRLSNLTTIKLVKCDFELDTFYDFSVVPILELFELEISKTHEAAHIIG